MKKLICSFSLITLVLGCLIANAQKPGIIPYQGTIADTSEIPYSGSFDFGFELRDAGNNTLWSSGNVNLAVNLGAYSVNLGQSPQPAIPDTLWKYNDAVKLCISFDDGNAGTQMLLPCVDIFPVPWAVRACFADQYCGDTLHTRIVIIDTLFSKKVIIDTIITKIVKADTITSKKVIADTIVSKIIKAEIICVSVEIKIDDDGGNKTSLKAGEVEVDKNGEKTSIKGGTVSTDTLKGKAVCVEEVIVKDPNNPDVKTTITGGEVRTEDDIGNSVTQDESTTRYSDGLVSNEVSQTGSSITDGTNTSDIQHTGTGKTEIKNTHAGPPPSEASIVVDGENEVICIKGDLKIEDANSKAVINADGEITVTETPNAVRLFLDAANNLIEAVADKLKVVADGVTNTFSELFGGLLKFTDPNGTGQVEKTNDGMSVSTTHGTNTTSVILDAANKAIEAVTDKIKVIAQGVTDKFSELFGSLLKFTDTSGTGQVEKTNEGLTVSTTHGTSGTSLVMDAANKAIDAVTDRFKVIKEGVTSKFSELFNSVLKFTDSSGTAEVEKNSDGLNLSATHGANSAGLTVNANDSSVATASNTSLLVARDLAVGAASFLDGGLFVNGTPGALGGLLLPLGAPVFAIDPGLPQVQSFQDWQIQGDVNVGGNLTKGGGSFKIDHPLDPYNKYLYHSFVESPDMMNIYNGNIKTDKHGNAVVEMPEYFEALNYDFRYQLTVIGDFAQAIIAEEISGGQFKIKTDKPKIKVSWQVTGVRQDTYANENRIQAEVDKEPGMKGSLLYPPRSASNR